MRLNTHTATRSASRNRFAAMPLVAALAAAAVLSACSSSSAWRSSSAKTSDRTGGKVAAAPAPKAGTSAQGRSAPAPVAGAKPSSASAGGASAVQQQTPSPQHAATSAQGDGGETAEAARGSEAGTAGSRTAGGRTTEVSTALSHPAETSAQGAPADGTAGVQARDATGIGTDGLTSSWEQGAAGAGGRDALAATDATRGDVGQAGSSRSGAQGEERAGSNPASTADTAGTVANASPGQTAAADDAGRGAGSAAPRTDGTSGATAAGTSSETYIGAAGANLDQATAAAATPSTSDTSAAGASDAGSTLSGEHAAQRGGGNAQPDEVIIGVVDTPGKKATPTETVIPQTLGGMLPLTLGVEGEGEFDFDKAVLREQVRGVLDDLARKLKSADYDRLEIIGHADRIGTEDYNQYLSERRAWAVARYLIEQGVPATKVRVEGRGMHDPLTTVRACEGLPREQAITCLQKDRRVVISASIRRVDVNVH